MCGTNPLRTSTTNFSFAPSVAADDKSIEGIAGRIPADPELLRPVDLVFEPCAASHEKVNLVNQICSRKKIPRRFY